MSVNWRVVIDSAPRAGRPGDQADNLNACLGDAGCTQRDLRRQTASIPTK